jgi:hypothetical protein
MRRTTSDLQKSVASAWGKYHMDKRTGPANTKQRRPFPGDGPNKPGPKKGVKQYRAPNHLGEGI